MMCGHGLFLIYMIFMDIVSHIASSSNLTEMVKLQCLIETGLQTDGVLMKTLQ